jgi:N-acetylmuramoyl-L-alanine amidase
VSRKLTKENVLLPVIIAVLIIIPALGFAGKTIQTTQHIIVIDPGHGGTQSGLVTSGGLKEKTIALKLAQKTAQRLETRYNVILTRTQDIDVPFRERMFTANKNSADFFISIHLNHSKNPSFFIYYFDPPKPHKPSTPAVKNSWKSTPLLHQSESKRAINSFLKVFSAHKQTDRFSSKGAPIILLEGANMPALLIEPLSISTLPQHPDEIENILDEYAVIIAKSIDLYFKNK